MRASNAAFAPHPDEPGPLEDANVFPHGRHGHRKVGRELADRNIPGNEMSENGPSRRIRERHEHVIQTVLVNHSVLYIAVDR